MSCRQSAATLASLEGLAADGSLFRLATAGAYRDGCYLLVASNMEGKEARGGALDTINQLLLIERHGTA